MIVKTKLHFKIIFLILDLIIFANSVSVPDIHVTQNSHISPITDGINQMVDHPSGGSHTSYLDNVLVVGWHYEKFTIHITIILFLFIVIIFRMLYHRIHIVAKYVPESLVLILIGIIFGAIMRYGLSISFESQDTIWRLTPDLFLTYLLPPIILESSYNLYNRTFGEYLGSIVLYAVVGTILNFFIIGFVMYGLDIAGAMGPQDCKIGLKGYLLFASLIVAVDPVAVLAIFQDIGVDLGLYYMVFGESLLNDAVTIVLYSIMEKFMGKDTVEAYQIVLGIVSFFTIALGGLLLGIIIGVITCLTTRIKTNADFVIVLLLGYFSYIIADVVGWSGLIAMIGCGLVQAAYAFHNISPQSVIIVREVTKQAAGLTESIVFLFLGIEILGNLTWHTGFMLWGIFLCIISRTIVTFGLSALINWVRVDIVKITMTEQLILIYGGLRGAVAFALAYLINEHSFPSDTDGKKIKSIMITAVLFIILFTVGLMGITMKPIVKLLKVKMAKSKNLSIFSTLNTHTIDQILASIEAITGQNGRNRVRDYFLKLDDRYIRKILQREPLTHDQKIVKIYEKIALKLHYATINPSKSSKHLLDLPKGLQKKHSQGSFYRLPSLQSISNLHLDLERGGFYEVQPDGSLRRKASTTGAEHVIDMSQLENIIRSTRKASIVENGHQQEPFRSTLSNILKAKNLVILHKNSIVTSSADKPTIYRPHGRINLSFSSLEEEPSNGKTKDKKAKFTIGAVTAQEEIIENRKEKNENSIKGQREFGDEQKMIAKNKKNKDNDDNDDNDIATMSWVTEGGIPLSRC